MRSTRKSCCALMSCGTPLMSSSSNSVLLALLSTLLSAEAERLLRPVLPLDLSLDREVDLERRERERRERERRLRERERRDRE